MYSVCMYNALCNLSLIEFIETKTAIKGQTLQHTFSEVLEYHRVIFKYH